MKLRTECVKYGNERPDVLNQEGSPSVFVIPKETTETLTQTGFTVAQIAALFVYHKVQFTAECDNTI